MSILQYFKSFVLFPFCLVLVFILINPSLADAQSCPANSIELILPDSLTVMPGNQVCFDVKVNNFKDIVLFFFVINFNSTALKFTSANPTVSGLTGFTAGDVTPPRASDPDIIRILWSHPNLSASSLPNGTVLLNLCFTVIGKPGNDSQILFNNAGLGSPAEFLNVNNQSFSPCNPKPQSGTINIIPVPSTEPQAFITGQCGSETGSQGKVELKVFYGTKPYTVRDNLGNTVSGTANQSVFLFENLPVGTRTYTVTDQAGRMSAPVSVNITNDPAFSIEPVRIKAPSCPADDDGLLQISVAGGKPFRSGKYFFDWGNNQVGIGQSELKNLTNGTYTVVVSDSLGCKQTKSYTLERTPIEIQELNITNTLCEGRMNGSIQVTASGGGPFSKGYIWSIEKIEGDNLIPFGSTTTPIFDQTFRVLPAGDYRITAQDSVDRRKECAVQKEFTVGVERELSIELVDTDPSICADNLQNANLRILSSTGGFDFPVNVQLIKDGVVVSDTAYSGTTLFTVRCVPSGTYTVRIEDSQNCSTTTSLLIAANTIEVQDSILKSPSCNGEENGFISLDVTSEYPPISYNWSNGIEGVGKDSIGGLPGGSYSVVIKDSTGLKTELFFELSQPAPFSVEVEADDILCPKATGALRAIPSGGIGQLQYQWTPNPQGGSGSVLADIKAGTYSVMATDANGCSAVDSFTLTNPIAPIATTSNINAPQCVNESSGTVTISVQATEQYPGPFFFETSTGVRGSSGEFNNFPSGSGNANWVLFGDENCAFDTVYFDIPNTQPYTIDRANTIISKIKCFDDQGTDGATVMLKTIGPDDLSIAWPDINATGPDQSGLSAGIYKIVLSKGTCMAEDSIVITQPDELTVSIDSSSSTFALCGGDNNTQLAVSVTGGTTTGAYTYEWQNSANNIVSTSDKLSSAGPGDYTLKVTDSNGCEANLSASVFEPSPISATIGEVRDPICEQDRGYITIADASGGIGAPYRYQVNTAPAIPVSDTATIIPGNITLRVFDQNGCSWDSSLVIMQPFELNVSLGPDANVELGESINLTASINSQVGIDSIFWGPAESLQCLDEVCLQVSAAPLSTTLYQVLVKDINGCLATDDINISVARTSNIYVPTAFSPNGNFPGNRIFKVFAGTGVSTVDFIRIYDRWGNLVHAEEAAQPRLLSGVGNWNGYYNNDATKELNAGVYMYVVQVSFTDGGNPELRRGNVTLIR